jgi:2-polyprenyl-3-methyl-5-hydroxy-6-metoxy-1,4-benzoquinol methylase
MGSGLGARWEAGHQKRFDQSTCSLMIMLDSEVGRPSRNLADDGMRFAFGANWKRFLQHLDEDRIRKAEESLKTMLGVRSLDERTFLDIGSGSGIFSLAARRMGAKVVSFDFDPQSVACAEELRRRFFPNDHGWKVGRGSVLDEGYMNGLGRFDIVYSWGVLHHTGDMWRALEHAARAVRPGGKLLVAIYNDQGRASQMWTRVKKAYNRLPRPLRFLILVPAFMRLWGPTMLRDLIRLKPLAAWRGYSEMRGMSPWHDVMDWVGGWPFEVAKPEEVFDFCRARGFQLERLATCGGGIGCNEYLLVRSVECRDVEVGVA